MRIKRPRRFRPADAAQQIVGGFLLAGPFVVTEEVWLLAGNMGVLHAFATIAIVFGIGYATLYEADSNRDPDSEQEIAGVPLRFISLMGISFGSVTVLALTFDAPGTFLADVGDATEVALITFKAVSVGAVFSVVGAATADSVFSRD